MHRAAVYARHSTDKQERSCEDQIHLCRQYAERNDLRVIIEQRDEAISGASTRNRPGLQFLLNDARAGRIDAVIVEDLHRLSRNQADVTALHQELDYLGVDILAVSTGRVDDLQAGVLGIVGQQFRKAIAANTRRGMNAVVRSGRSPGGATYGYRPLPALPGEKKGRLEIVPEEADIVRQIYEQYAKGVSPRAIAGALNKKRVFSPRGGQWNASSIGGNAQRHHGILYNEVYVGRRVYNKTRYVKNPANGRREVRVNPPSEWLAVDVPELRIIDDALWDAVRARKAAAKGLRPEQNRAKHMLSGLLKCGECGGAISVVSTGRGGGRVQCSRHRASGTCSNGASFYRRDVEEMVQSKLKEKLGDKKSSIDYERDFSVKKERFMESSEKLSQRLARVNKELERVADAVLQGIDPRVLRERSDKLTSERDDIERALSSKPTVEKLNWSHYLVLLDKDQRAAVRALVRSVTIFPDRRIVIDSQMGEIP
jgi:site-specific DNA recombinase